MIYSRLRRTSGRLCLLGALLFTSEGCAHVLHLAPADYDSVPAGTTTEITTKEGRVYEFEQVRGDSARFLGEIDVVRNVVGKSGHLEAIETTQSVEIPYSRVVSVVTRKADLLGTVFLIGGIVVGALVLGNAFAPVDQGTTGGGTPPPPSGAR